MGTYLDKTDPEKFLMERDNRWHYVRRVPTRVANLYGKTGLERVSLRTSNVRAARLMRDRFVEIDDELWAALELGVDRSAAVARRDAARTRVLALEPGYRRAVNLDQAGQLIDIISEVLMFSERVGAKNDDQSKRPFDHKIPGRW